LRGTSHLLDMLTQRLIRVREKLSVRGIHRKMTVLAPESVSTW
jgi:hypothetical protein